MKSMTMREVWEQYQMAILSSSKRRSQVTEAGRWLHHISPVLDEKSIDNLTSFDLLMLRRELEKKKLSPQSVRHCLSLLRRVVNKAAEWGKYGGQLPSFKGIMPKFDNRRQRFLDHKEFTVLLNALKKVEESQNWHDIALFAVSTGLRRGEIFSLRWHDINFNGKFMTVLDTKSSRNRIVQLNDITLDIAVKKKQTHS